MGFLATVIGKVAQGKIASKLKSAGVGSGVKKLLGALGPSIGGALAASDRFSEVSAAERAALREDVQKLRTGQDLGMTDAEKNAGVAGAVRAAQAAQAGLVDDVQRQGAAQGFSQSGAQQQTLAQYGEQAAGAGAAARAEIEAANADVARQRAEAIRERMTARRKELRGQGEEAGERVGDVLTGSSGGSEEEGLSSEELAAVRKDLSK